VITHIFNFSLSEFMQISGSQLSSFLFRKSSVRLNFRITGQFQFCAISKGLESLTVDQILRYLEQNNILDLYQSVYRKDLSTQALIRVLDDVRWGTDKRCSSIFFDFTKTFDNECYVRLINKFKELGFVSSTLQ